MGDTNAVLREVTENVERLIEDQRTAYDQIDRRLDKVDKALEQQEVWISTVERKAGAKRFGTSVVGEVESGEKKRIAEAYGYFYKGVLLAGTRPEFAKKWREQGVEALSALGAVTRVALQEDTNSEGGYLIPVQQIGKLLGAPLRGQGIAAGLAMHQTMTSKTATVPTVASEPTVAITNEEGVIPDSAPANPFGQALLTAKKLAALFTISEELVADSAPDVVGEFCVKRTVSALTAMEDAQALEGDGIGVNFTGLFSAAGVNSTAVSAAPTNFDKFADGLALLSQPTLDAETLTWVLHRKLWFALVKLKVAQYSGDTNGDYRLGPGMLNSATRSLLGVPVRLSDSILTNRGGGTNETTAYVGAFGEGMIFGDRQALAIQVDPYSKMDSAQLRVRVMERIALNVVVPSVFCKVTAIQV